jgi:hypothetical protein
MSNSPFPGRSSSRAYDLAEQIGEQGVSSLLEIVCDAYQDLCKKHNIKQAMSEDEITEELFNDVVFAWSNSAITETIRPIHQKIDKTFAKARGRPPTIDFCFRDSWVREAFFGFECKLLAEGNNGLYDDYVRNGLYRYLQGTYCSKGSAGSLVGYVKLGNLATVVRDVKTRVDNERILKAMVLASAIGQFKEHYVSIHSRERALPSFCVHHLFFFFACKNENVRP